MAARRGWQSTACLKMLPCIVGFLGSSALENRARPRSQGFRARLHLAVGTHGGWISSLGSVERSAISPLPSSGLGRLHDHQRAQQLVVGRAHLDVADHCRRLQAGQRGTHRATSVVPAFRMAWCRSSNDEIGVGVDVGGLALVARLEAFTNAALASARHASRNSSAPTTGRRWRRRARRSRSR